MTSRNGWVIFFTIILALMLSITPMPAWAKIYRPLWITLVLIYWCLALPQRVSIGTAWIVGVVQDVLHGTLLGHHALSLSAVAYAAAFLHLRIRNYPLWQQSVTVLILLLLERMLELWVMGATGQQVPDVWFWTPAFTSAVLWPWLFIVLRDVRRRFDIF